MTANSGLNSDQLKRLIREVPDWPKKGILFYDITTLLKDKVGFATLIDALSEHYLNAQIDAVLAIEARGFIFGPALAYRLNAGFVPIRKPGKLPAPTVKWSYELEYGIDTLEIHKDAIHAAQKVIIVDDLLATGGTDPAGSCRRGPSDAAAGRTWPPMPQRPARRRCARDRRPIWRAPTS